MTALPPTDCWKEPDVSKNQQEQTNCLALVCVILESCRQSKSKMLKDFTAVKQHQMDNFETHKNVVGESLQLTASHFEESNLKCEM